MASIWQDIRFGLRMLRHAKRVTAVAVISLALAIAGNTAVFGLVNARLYRPLPYPQADRLVLFGEREASSPPIFTSSAANFLDWRERATSFQALGAFRATFLSFGLAGDRLDAIAAGEMSPDLLRTLGPRVTRGRLFSDDESRPGASRVQRDLFVMGRFKDGVTMTQARAEMNAVVKRIEDEHPDTNRGVLVDVLN